MGESIEGAVHGARPERGPMLAAITNAVVRVYKQFYGKGPTKARSDLGEDLLLVVLEGGLTRIEQTLCDRGQGPAVLHVRRLMRGAIELELRAAIEGELDRSVRSLMVTVDPVLNLEVLACVLDSRGTPTPPREPLPGADGRREDGAAPPARGADSNRSVSAKPGVAHDGPWPLG